MDLMKWFGNTPTGIDGVPLPSVRIETLEKMLQERLETSPVLDEVRRFRSRKNVVLYLRIGPSGRNSITELVAKIFLSGRYDIELDVLRKSWKHGLAVPEVIAARDGVILMSYIPGETLVERINRTFEPHLIDLLAQWYYTFHSIHNKIKGDPRLRNFICAKNTLHGVDFEETDSGSWMLDIAGVSASLLDTNPIFDSRKIRLSWHFLDSYLVLSQKKRTRAIENEFNQVLASTLKQTAIWRKDDRISKIAEKIHAEGLPKD
jgi:tRNA A-37 threonylcarbamoyl transferase component Bud32